MVGCPHAWQTFQQTLAFPTAMCVHTHTPIDIHIYIYINTSIHVKSGPTVVADLSDPVSQWTVDGCRISIAIQVADADLSLDVLRFFV